MRAMMSADVPAGNPQMIFTGRDGYEPCAWTGAAPNRTCAATRATIQAFSISNVSQFPSLCRSDPSASTLPFGYDRKEHIRLLAFYEMDRTSAPKIAGGLSIGSSCTNGPTPVMSYQSPGTFNGGASG